MIKHKEDSEKSEYRELIAVIKPKGLFQLDWQVINKKPLEKELQMQESIYSKYKENIYEALLFLGFIETKTNLSQSLSFLSLISAKFIDNLLKTPAVEMLRDKTHVSLESQDTKSLLTEIPFVTGAEYLDDKWIKLLFNQLNEYFCTKIQNYNGSVEQFLAQYNPKVHLADRIFFHLVESKKEDYPFAFLATYSSDTVKEGAAKHLPLKNALLEYGENSKKLLLLLSTVNKVAEKSSFISEIIESGEIFHPLGLSTAEAYTFLKEIPIYEEANIVCRIPNWWKNKSEAIKMSVTVGNASPSRLNLDALVDFDAKLLLGGEKLTEEEIRKLISEAEGLAFIKGKWVEVNHEKLKETLKAYEQAQKLMGKNNINMVEAMRFQLSAQKLLKVPEEVLELEVTNGDWLDSVVTKLKRPETIDAVGCGKDFKANLREYQSRGLSWLNFMKTLGLGACLADDMGLGKTVQVIALLNYIRNSKSEKNLLIIPASLIGNWCNEIDKFAPKLKYLVIHPSENKKLGDQEADIIDKFDVFITTYGMISKFDWLKAANWNSVILDEAQAIKNPNTKQTKLVKQLKAEFKIAMTGTPIENRLSDLWSLFDFLNKGLLGTAREFTDYTKRLKEDGTGYNKLKAVISPFILRRLKTDKTVINDLPDKIEMKTYAELTKKQVILYNKLVKELKEKLKSSEEGIERKGLVLASLMKFKQICNHPDEYLGQREYDEAESGKFKRLREICETIYEKRERVLVFTQFKEMTQPISDFLEKVFEHSGLVLHGGTTVKKRKDIVAKFQGEEYVPFMVLSIKAGGVGLNLTAANHVIHFDRWWNPAVENQATDRAFRIGQNKNVIVHKFITSGTIEEKIDAIIEDKIKLSNEIVPDIQEGWITEMGSSELIDLFSLTK